MKQNKNIWGEWSDPNHSEFFAVITSPETLNFIEWHLNKTFDELLQDDLFNSKTKNNIVSVILSDRYQDEGQIKRINFIKYLQENHSNDIELHIYGRGDLSRFGIKNHIKGLPPYCKDEALIPYKYHFNCENSFFMNYITEKLYDGILSETFTFYGGATNTISIYPKGGFELLNLDNFELAAQSMINLIKTNIFEKEYPNIKELKRLILENYTFSKRIYTIIENQGDVKVIPLYTNPKDIEEILSYKIPSTPPSETISQYQLDKILENHSVEEPSEDLIDTKKSLQKVVSELNETINKLNAIIELM